MTPLLNEFLSNFHFLRPLWLLALPPLLSLYFFRRPGAGNSAWLKVCDPSLIPYLLSAGRPTERWSGRFIPLAIVLLVVALAGPVFRERPRPVFHSTTALVILLDLSRSMDAADVAPSRLTRAKLKIIDICRQRREGQTALVVFAAEPFVVTPLTDDTRTIIAQLTALDSALMPTQGTRTDRAVTKALELFRQAGQPRGELLLISDAVTLNDPLDLPPSLRLHVLAVGTASGAPIPLPGGGFFKDAQGDIVLSRLDTDALKKLADDHGGRYATLTADDHDIDYLLKTSGHRAAANEQKDPSAQHLTAATWIEDGAWLLLPLLPLGGWLLRGYLWLLPLCLPLLTGSFCLLTATPAHALSWNEVWHNREQRATQQFEAEDYKAAAENFSDPRWQAAARYRAENFVAAAKVLENLTGADDHYNRGNALARAGQIDAAMAAYEEALRRDPEHADARHNLHLLQRQKEQQKGEQQQQQKQQDQGDQGDQEDPSQDQAGKGQQQGGQDQHSENNGQQNADQSTQSSPDSKHKRAEQNRSDKDEAQETQETPAEEQQPDTTKESADATVNNAGQPAPPVEESPLEAEQRQMMEQWLRRIPDDPGGLLRRKFLYQYQQRETRPEKQSW
ncbi:MAG: VWA domain-containing protein [Desulfuromonadaceae bacterium]|nr:VWA domain-containing protein [Desulfuromonadaceae bacterium]